MPGREIVSINGEITDLQEGKVSVLDHCFLYGDGVFEGIRFIQNSVLLHREHMERLYASAEYIRLPMIAREEYERQLFAAIRASRLNSGYVRVVVTRGSGGLGINPAKCTNSQVVIIVTQISLYPDEYYEKGVKVVVSSINKIPYRSLDCRAKSCNYLNNVMASWEYIDRGAAEALQTDERGFVSEATVVNVFGVSQEQLFTPSVETNCLEGITRGKIIEIAEGLGLSVEEGFYTSRKFMSADEIFLTGTGAGVVPVTQIEDKVIGAGKIGPITKLLRAEYEKRLLDYSTPIE